METWKRLDRLRRLRDEAYTVAAECREAVRKCERHLAQASFNAPVLEMLRLLKIYKDGVVEHEEEALMFDELIARDEAGEKT